MSFKDKEALPLTPDAALSLFIKNHHILISGHWNKPVFAGVSGGADSVCLLHTLVGFPGIREQLTVLHFNHQTDPQRNRQEEEFVRVLAETMKVGFIKGYPLHHSPSMSEERLRTERYHFFQGHLDRLPGSILFLGHHLTDQAETILMNIFRNRGIRGLLGMNPFREGKYARPFLSLPSSVIRQELEEKNLPHLEDPSNQDDRYLRNRVRHELSPLIKKIFSPAGIESLPFLATQLAEEIRPEINNIHSLLEDERRGSVKISFSLFRFLSPVRQSRLIEEILNNQSRKWNLPTPPPGNILRSLNRNPPHPGPMGSGWALSINSGKIHLLHHNTESEINEQFSPFLTFEGLDTTKNMRQNVILPRGGVLRLAVVRYDPLSSVWEKGLKISRQCILSPEALLQMTVGYTFRGAKMDLASPVASPRNLNRELKRSRLSQEDRTRLPVLYLNGRALWVPGVLPLPQTCLPNDLWGLTMTYFSWKES